MSKKKKKKSNRGRPTVMTAEVVGKIELGFTMGLNKTECCEYAGISRDALYDYVEKHPDFSDKIEILKSHPSMKAKINIADRIEKGDIELSQWWLERKNPEEFSTKQNINATVTAAVKLEDIL